MQRLLDFLYPPVCPFCGRISPEGICDKCREKIIRADGAFCLHCGKPLEDETKEYCYDCERRREKSFLTQGRALWLHREPVSGAIYQLKYKNKRHRGILFGAEMAERYGDLIDRWEIREIIPVPLHASRKRKRGYNQAEVIARELSCHTGIPCRTDVLFRIRKTKPQKMLDDKQRADNLKGAFAVSAGWKACGNVLLIDDIYTTGATLERAAKMLKKAGARKIYFLTVSIGQGI